MQQESKAIGLAILEKIGYDAKDVADIVNDVDITGTNTPFIPSPFKVAELITGLDVAISALANLISKDRLGHTQKTAINIDHAALSITNHFINNADDERFETLLPKLQAASAADPALVIRGRWANHWNTCFRCSDRWIQLAARITDTPEVNLAAIGFTQPEIAQLLEWCLNADERYLRTVEAKFLEWKAYELEAVLSKLNACCAIVPRSYDEFMQSEHGKLSSTWAPVQLVPQQPSVNGAWQPVPWQTLTNPAKQGLLHGIKIVELTRMVMGPVAGYMSHTMGANVIKVSLPALDEGFYGKRCVFVDLRSKEGRDTIRKLIQEADVFLENNAFGAMDRSGLGPKDVFDMVKDRKKGLIYVRGNAAGFEGPYKTAPGFDHLAQSLCGMMTAHGAYHKFTGSSTEHRPQYIPFQILDNTTGHLLYLGMLDALRARATKGGSYIVQSSLLQGGLLLQSFGQHDAATIERAWSKYEPQASESSFSEIYGAGSFSYSIKFQDKLFREGHPASFNPAFFYKIKNCYWPSIKYPNGGCTMLMGSPVIKMDETPLYYRLGTRPFGYDTVTEFLPMDLVGDMVSLGLDSDGVALYTMDRSKLDGGQHPSHQQSLVASKL
ncbi:hypothetical protein SmJEL517_g00816 [Synchytrium microbalum]|uniref:Uncharacterized protein n=1 Tax=Synchytrium microbalum TaxID=1806994 RepID=A0A507CGD0_9FUNG|nr:uncharacterized protein SmJEL517_g00816 [Synchytrium microbalum]TPX37076.1 hypothetical protein SmJEL517_g00816 [Synchytrium microbalum]